MSSVSREFAAQVAIATGPAVARISSRVREFLCVVRAFANARLPDKAISALLYLDIIVLSDTVLRISTLHSISLNTVNQPEKGWFWLIPLVTAAAGYLSSRHQAKKQAQANIQQQQLAHQQNLELWNKQNEYNAPTAQMARYQAAGLNPNLIYGSGGSSGNAGSITPVQPAQTPVGAPLQLPAMLSAYQDFRLREAQINQVQASAENTHSRTMSEAVRRYLMDLQGQTGEFDLERRKYLAPYQAAIVGNQARASEAKLQQEFQKLKLMDQQQLTNLLNQEYARKKMQATDVDIERRQADLIFQRYRNEWMKHGITSSDNMILRILVRMAAESGISQEFFK